MSETKYMTVVGLDVHQSGIQVAVIVGAEKVVTQEWQSANTPEAIRRLVRKLQRMHGSELRFCYEAGCCGYALQRQFRSLGVDGAVVAPSLIPRKPGERIKTDRRDARKLAELFKAGLLTEVHPPTAAEEAVRDLTRAREDGNRDLMSARHRLSKMLVRQGHVYRQGCHWTQKHRAWLNSIRFEDEVLRMVFQNYLLAIEQIEERVRQLESQLERVAQSPGYAERVGWLSCLRGVSTITAMTLLAELHDPGRFRNARELMSYLGLTPGENSSGGRVRRGGITCAGNAHVRRVLVESAWAYRQRPGVSAYLRRRREGQPAAVIALADRAQQRLHQRYFRLKEGYRKHHNVVVVAVARELVGFIWGILNHKQAA
jgi:transposase